MNLTRILSVLVPVVLLAPVGAVLEPASAATATTITINGRPHVGIFHDNIGQQDNYPDVFQHKGRLTTADGDPVDGATVFLERKLTTDDDWVRFTGDQDVVTNANGVYTFLTYVAG